MIFRLFQQIFHFSTLFQLSLGWCDVPTYVNVKSTLEQSRVCERWNLQCRINVVYLNIVMGILRQRGNNVVIFNIEFDNVGQHQNNVVNMTIFKKNKWYIGAWNKNNLNQNIMNSKFFLLFYNLPHFISHFKRNTCKATKIIKTFENTALNELCLNPFT